MSENQTPTENPEPDVSQSGDGPFEVPEQEDFTWPLRVEMLGEQWVFYRADPAELFQHVNNAKIKEGLMDNEHLFRKIWDQYVAPMDRPDSQKPDLFNLKGSEKKNEAFMFVQGVIKDHFLDQTTDGRAPKPGTRKPNR